jgi:hypothetical protein
LLWKENADLRELSKEMRDQLAENEYAKGQQTGDQINQNSQINVQDNPSWLKRWLLKIRRYVVGG